jgi:hypothetical protein
MRLTGVVLPRARFSQVRPPCEAAYDVADVIGFAEL